MKKFVVLSMLVAIAGALVLAPAGRGATGLPGPNGAVPTYQGGLAAGYCVEIGTNSWGPFRTRTDAENYAGHLAAGASLTYCPIR